MITRFARNGTDVPFVSTRIGYLSINLVFLERERIVSFTQMLRIYFRLTLPAHKRMRQPSVELVNHHVFLSVIAVPECTRPVGLRDPVGLRPRFGPGIHAFASPRGTPHNSTRGLPASLAHCHGPITPETPLITQKITKVILSYMEYRFASIERTLNLFI